MPRRGTHILQQPLADKQPDYTLTAEERRPGASRML